MTGNPEEHETAVVAELRERRDELARRVAELTWELGGLTFEMAIRDHFRLDVLVKRAAVLQGADAELAAIERLLANAREGVGGTCRSCGAPYSRGAAYCWRCGHELLPAGQSLAATESAATAQREPAPPLIANAAND
jgi:hypothetical protein